MLEKLSDLYGRQIRSQDVSNSLLAQSDCKKMSAFKKTGTVFSCLRCGCQINSQLTKLSDERLYCASCIQMGRLTSSDELVTIQEPNYFDYKGQCCWQGSLTSDQQRCAKQVIHTINERTKQLLWAVTGAGKTEMLFPGIQQALEQQLRVAIVSPRIDVILELAPRIRTAFPEADSCLLYGKTPERYRYTQLVFATVHQLLRFYHAFDVLIVDEVDVFPLAGNQQLYYAINKAQKNQSAVIYLTATPDNELKRQIKTQRLAVSYLPRRYHGYPLATITNVRVGNWRSKLARGKLPVSLVKAVKQRIEQNQSFLLFVPHVADLKLVAEALQPDISFPVVTVHAEDPDRINKVQMMRNHEISFLITTTILERGVTFPAIDVLVLGADDDVFSSAALIQIAGRVGRSIKRPTGTVCFYNQRKTNKIRQAQREINMMNKKAGFK